MDNPAKKFFNLVVGAIVGGAIYVAVSAGVSGVSILPTAIPEGEARTGVSYTISSENSDITVLGVTKGDGEAVSLDTFGGLWRVDSSSIAKADRSSDTAWVLVNEAFGCDVSYESGVDTDFPDLEGYKFEYAQLEGHGFSLPSSVDGYSGGVAFVLAQATNVTGMSLQGVAGTGVVDLGGYIRPVGGAAEKVEAAINSGNSKIFVPRGNLDVARRAAGERIEVIAVDDVHGLLEAAGFTSAGSEVSCNS